MTAAPASRLVLKSLHKLSETFGRSQAISVAATGVVECLRGLALADDRIVQRTPRAQQRTARLHKLRDTQHTSVGRHKSLSRREMSVRTGRKRAAQPSLQTVGTPEVQSSEASLQHSAVTAAERCAMSGHDCPASAVQHQRRVSESVRMCKTWAARDAHHCMRWRGREARRRRRRWGRARPAAR